ncbi:PREDICTED: uncharacterized protein LOC109233620 [Nicotiana attenuata]|uniref:uncharacterized protein LOC109233620 n=1 Tax=Nicotiana attenuata TaxID=49451 RepID=UPI000904A284|nr:PREDICTED: uncharacterized protein LOC109233620 [Nicotiana attenuata]
MKKVTRRWSWYANYDAGIRGRIWIMWDLDLVDFMLIETQTLYIHGLIKIYALNVEFTFTIVYGLHTIQDRRSLWTGLGNLANKVQGPWVVMGDFNSIIDAEDRIGGAPVQDVETRDFRSFLVDSSFVELIYVGRRYTWTNSHVFSKIDWAFVNSDWIHVMPHLEATIMDSGCSNHSPISISFEDAPGRGHRPFRFLNCLSDHPNFIQLVRVDTRL